MLPILGAGALWALPAASRRLARPIALGVSLAVLVLGAAMALQFDTVTAGTHQFSELVSWIPAFGVTYAVGVDGVGLLMVLLSVVLVPIVVLAAWR